jgi:hypothetical protein
MGLPPSGDPPLVDSHLDLAENATLFGRDLTSRVAEIRALEGRATRQATVSLPELERGGIAVVFAPPQTIERHVPTYMQTHPLLTRPLKYCVKGGLCSIP